MDPADCLQAALMWIGDQTITMTIGQFSFRARGCGAYNDSTVRWLRSRPIQRFSLPVMAGVLMTSLLPAQAAAPQLVASVHTIQGGLRVNPPRSASAPGRVRQPLFTAYGLRTVAQQRASIGFVDRTVLFINQRTDLVLRSASVTALRRGEVAETDGPGTQHQVVTASAVASAIGTIFDVFITPRSPRFAPRPLGETDATFAPGTTTVSVVTGRVTVSNPFGRVTVLPGFWTHVQPGTAPTVPTRHHARLDVAWKRKIAP